MKLSDIIGNWLGSLYEINRSALGPDIFYISARNRIPCRPIAHIYDQYVIAWNGAGEPNTISAYDAEFFAKLDKHIKNWEGRA